jgi:alpha-glucosidase
MISVRLWILLILPCCAVAVGAWTPIGNVSSNTMTSSGVECYLSSGAIAKVEVLDSRMVRVRVNPTGIFSQRISPAIATNELNPGQISIGETNGAIWLITEQMRVAVFESPFQVNAWFADGSPMVADSTGSVLWDETTGKILASKDSPAGENYFGLGLRGGPINRKGRTLVLRNTDNSAYTEFTEPLYQSYPFYYALRDGKAYGIFFDNPACPFF